MPPTMIDEPPSSSESVRENQLNRLLDAVSNASRHVGEAQGGALALLHPGVPGIVGWFRQDVSAGFSAMFPHIVSDTLLERSDIEPESRPSPAAAPSKTWSRLRIELDGETHEELWLYRSEATKQALQSWDRPIGPSLELQRTLEHLKRWYREPDGDDALEILHRFSQSLNRAASAAEVSQLIAESFVTTFHASAAAVHRFSDEWLLIAEANAGLIPILDGHDAFRQPDAKTISQNWLFDVFPLRSQEGRPIGAVTCFWNHDLACPGASLSLAGFMAEQATAAIERCRTVERSLSLVRSAAGAIADAVDARDSFTRHHAGRVARYSREVSLQLGLPDHEVECIEIAGLLHDVGKIGVPDRVLQTPGALEPDDWDLIRRHPEFGATIATGFPSLARVAPLIRHHHERFDGTGYPFGLRGDETPLGARIIGVVEAFDTLVTGRPYQSPWSVERTLTTLEGLAGTQFDPDIVQRFAGAIRAGTIHADLLAPVQTSDLSLHRWIGAEARAFGLLQRIGNEVGELLDLRRFLRRLTEIIEVEFPTSVVDIFIRDRENHRFVAMVNALPRRTNRGVYVMKKNRGVIGWVVSHGKSQNIPDVRLDPRYVADDGRETLSELVVPMLLDDGCIGVLNIESPRLGAYSRTDQNVLEIIAAYVARAVQVAELHGQVKRQSEVDSMTGLLNHRAFYRTLEVEVDRAARADDCLSVAIIDVDGFKSINDSQGHLVGDAVIQRLAQILIDSAQHGDAIARYGGDEFSIIRPGATHDAMVHHMCSIDAAIQAAGHGSPLPRISWGVASYPEDGTQPTELVAQADAAMYASRQRSTADR